MRRLTALFAVLFLLPFVAAADAVYVFSGSDSVAAAQVNGAAKPQVTFSATLVYGGLAQQTDQAWSGKIVLVDRGVTSVLDKINAVKAGGGIAVIVANNVSGGFVATLGSAGGSTLVGVTISMEDGAKLKAKVGTPVAIGLTPPPLPAINFPDPVGHEGEALVSDGTKLVYTKFAPNLSQLKMGVTLSVGAPLTLTVESDGTPPLTFQWTKDGQNIAGATNAVFFVASVQPSDAGRYICVSSNALGTATSQTFTLTINP